MKSLCIVSLLILCVGVVTAQQKNVTPDYNLQQLTVITPSAPSFVGFRNQARELEGTPYLLDEWQKARVQIKGASSYSKEVEVLLDLVTHQLYVGFEDGTVGGLPASKIDHVIVSNDSEELFLKVINLKKEYGGGEDQFRYYQVLHDGEYKLFQEYAKEFKKGENVQTIGNYNPANKFSQTETYWLISPNSKTIQRVKLSPKSLAKALPKQANRIKTLVKKEDLDVRQEEDAVQLLALLEGD